MGYKEKSPIPIAEGGTNATSMATTDGVVYFDGTSLVTTTAGTATQVLTSNGTGLAPTFQDSSGGGITTLAGDTGTATGSTVTIAGDATNISTAATGATVTVSLNPTIHLPDTTSSASGVIYINSVPFMHSYPTTGFGNCFLGGAGNFTSTLAINNIGIGNASLASVSSGAFNNVGIGVGSLTNCSTGSNNIALSTGCLPFLLSGNSNLAIGGSSGSAYLSSESSNICIFNSGVVSESNVIHIGTQGTGDGQQNTCFIAGIYGSTVGATNSPVFIDSNGQLGTVGGSGGAITTLDGDTGSATGSTVTIAGGSNMSTSATGSTVTVNLVSSPSVSGSLTTGTTVTAGTNLVSTAGNLNLPDTTTSSKGIININSVPFMHAYPGTANLNCFLGGSGTFTVSGTANTGVGGANFLALTTGSQNTSIGAGPFELLTTGSLNTAIGTDTLAVITTGGHNTAVGAESLSGLATSGSYNTALGYNSGTQYSSTESSNVVIMNTGTSSDANTIRIGSQGSGNGQQNKCFIAGIAGVTVASSAAVLINTSTGQLGTVASSLRFKENIKKLHDVSILNLEPVSFNFISDSTKSKQFGLIAEDVAKIVPELVLNDADGLPYTVKYHDLPTLLLHEIKKLHERISFLERQIIKEDA